MIMNCVGGEEEGNSVYDFEEGRRSSLTMIRNDQHSDRINSPYYFIKILELNFVNIAHTMFIQKVE